MNTNQPNWIALIERLQAAGSLTEKGKKYAADVITGLPSRNPSNVAGRNLIVDIASQKMGHTVQVESLTIEAAYAQMLESSVACVGYWAQPIKLRVVCKCRDGIERALWITLDFLVLYPDRLELVECKPESALHAISLTQPGRYSRDDTGRWTSPEVEAALADYGIHFRVVSSADLNPVLLRNYTLLEEVRQASYSSASALEAIMTFLQNRRDGVPLAELVAQAGSAFTKNDIYVGILRRDVHVLLAHCLLVDDRTTLVFAEEYQAEAYRLMKFATVEQSERSLVLKAGTRLRWNGTNYSICNASRNKVYLMAAEGSPTAFPRDLLCSLIGTGEIELLDEVVVDGADQAETLKPYFTALTLEKQLLGKARNEFLRFLERHPEAKPEDFGLKPIKTRTVQRWKRAAHESMVRFGTPLWGLFDRPRPGRPRDALPKEMRDEMTAVAEELYFSKTAPSKTFVWRALRQRREARGLPFPSKGAYRRHLDRMKNLRDATESRQGKGAAYKYDASSAGGKNWITAGDFPLKVSQMDGKSFDILVVDDETGEVLGKPTLTLLTLPHYGSAPIGAAFLFEPESYRSGTMCLRDEIERFGEPVKYIVVDNGKAFNNATFDSLLATLGITKINRPPRDPRFASEIEALFRVIDREVIHNSAGNTKPLQTAREMTAEMNPEKLAIWTLSALWRRIEHYLFTMLWDAPSAALGTTPRLAFERDQKRAPDREGRFTVPPDQAKIAFFPEVDGVTRVVQPGRGIFVEGYYYWNDVMAKPHVEKTKVRVRYDPYELAIVFAAIGDTWVECTARHAPELRNVTERTRHLQVIARRRLKNNHAERRERTHGRKLACLGDEMLEDEKALREQRRARAQRQLSKPQHAHVSPQTEHSGGVQSIGSKLPKIDFSHLRKTAA
ncbi:Mu transposase C-terminal domain-containing protein [Opitutus terrae]|uniref:Mu transposase C-terminal domain-containing protein n=1 Tax=Opitutus terrae TaxID=107709 RepID=UPI00130520DE|nr:Mu transposase C-terminal domain-containing protein [Opitutus terrae]